MTRKTFIRLLKMRGASDDTIIIKNGDTFSVRMKTVNRSVYFKDEELDSLTEDDAMWLIDRRLVDLLLDFGSIRFDKPTFTGVDKILKIKPTE